MGSGALAADGTVLVSACRSTKPCATNRRLMAGRSRGVCAMMSCRGKKTATQVGGAGLRQQGTYCVAGANKYKRSQHIVLGTCLHTHPAEPPVQRHKTACRSSIQALHSTEI